MLGEEGGVNDARAWVFAEEDGGAHSLTGSESWICGDVVGRISAGRILVRVGGAHVVEMRAATVGDVAHVLCEALAGQTAGCCSPGLASLQERAEQWARERRWRPPKGRARVLHWVQWGKVGEGGVTRGVTCGQLWLLVAVYMVGEGFAQGDESQQMVEEGMAGRGSCIAGCRGGRRAEGVESVEEDGAGGEVCCGAAGCVSFVPLHRGLCDLCESGWIAGGHRGKRAADAGVACAKEIASCQLPSSVFHPPLHLHLRHPLPRSSYYILERLSFSLAPSLSVMQRFLESTIVYPSLGCIDMLC